MSNTQERLHFELKDFIVNVGWTHKIHAVRVDELEKHIRNLRIITIAISGIVSSGLIGILLTNVYWIKVFTAFLSLLTTIIVGITKEFNFEERLSIERENVNELWFLRTTAESLLSAIVYNESSFKEIEKLFEELKVKRNAIYCKLSDVSSKTITEASRLIKSRKDNDYDEDYKYFIPKKLMNIKGEE